MNGGGGIYSGSGATPNSQVNVTNTAGLKFIDPSNSDNYLSIFGDTGTPAVFIPGIADIVSGVEISGSLFEGAAGFFSNTTYIGTTNTGDGAIYSSSLNLYGGTQIALFVNGVGQFLLSGNGPEIIASNNKADFLISGTEDSYFQCDKTGADKTGILYKGFGENDTTGIGGDYSNLLPNSLVPKAYVDANTGSDTLIRQYKIDLSSTADTIQNLATYEFDAFTDKAVSDRVIAAFEINTTDTVNGTDFHFVIQDNSFIHILPALAGAAFELEQGENHKRWYVGDAPFTSPSRKFALRDIPKLNVSNGSGVTGIPSYVATEGTNGIWLTIYYIKP